MDTESAFVNGREHIINDAYSALRGAGSQHYAAAGEQFTRERLESLFDVVVAGIRDRELTSIIAYSNALAQERYNAGFGISEVQTAFNALEEASWRHLANTCTGEELIENVGLLGTVLGKGKDELAREYVSLASQSRVPSLDLSALFGGAGAGAMEEPETN